MNAAHAQTTRSSITNAAPSVDDAANNPVTTSAIHALIDANTPIILFDGVCKLCNVWSKFVLRFDRKQRFKLCSVQSPSGQYLLQKFGYPTNVFDTMLLIQNNTAYEKSDSFLKIMAQMGWPWRALVVARIIPRPIRDWLYDRIAKNRYRMFGKYDQCVLPRPEHQQRFLP